MLLMELILLGAIASYYARLLRLSQSLDENALRRQVAREVTALQTAVQELLKELHLSAQEIAHSLEEKRAAAGQALAALDSPSGIATPPPSPQPLLSLRESPKIVPLPKEEAPINNSKYERVYALASQGCDPAEIARQTRLALGEIELVLDLRARQ